MPEEHAEAPKLTLKIDGSAVSDAFMDDLTELVANSDLHLPGMFSLRLDDSQLTWSGGSLLALGKAVEISAQARKQGNEKGDVAVVFKGEITALEPEFGDGGQAWLTVRGYDKGHRLHRGKKTRTFLKMTDGDVVKKIAGEVGLSPDVDTTPITYPYILQNNQTNMEFLQERARRIGYWFFVDGVKGNLCFKKASAPDSGSGPELTWGENLYSFAPRLSVVHQADKVKVFGWDRKTKAVITADIAPTAPSNQAGQSGTGGDAAKTAFGGSAEAIVVSEPVLSVDDATAMAEALGQQISRNYLWAEGKCQGNPKVQAGAVVTVVLKSGDQQKTLGKFGGKYLVTSATHVYDGTQYATEFTITGQDPYTFSALLGADPAAPALTPGVVTAVVTNVKDLDGLGRVKVKFPWMGTPEVESDWIRVSTVMAGAERGFMVLPEVNDEVLVAFEQGNPDFPFVLGGLWSNTDKPPLATDDAVKDGKVVQRIYKSRAGHTILLDDTQSSELIKILSKSGHTILLDDKSGSEKISVVDKAGTNSVVIDSAKNTITVKCQGNLTLESATGDVAIKGMNVKIESQVDTSIKATANLNMEATAAAALKGTAKVEVSSAGQAVLKGSMTQIN